MEFIVSAVTDKGIVKQTNQDSLTVKILNTAQGKMTFALICDGMGGLESGELASSSVIRCFDLWLKNSFRTMSEQPLQSEDLFAEWDRLLTAINQRLNHYSDAQQKMGTTVVGLLITQTAYYFLNIGDSRVYHIDQGAKQITHDHTLAAREVERGNLTEQQAKTDRRRSVLLQCVGASAKIEPEFGTGDVAVDQVFLLCSDGFRHTITSKELRQQLCPNKITDSTTAQSQLDLLLEWNKERKEKDNISAIVIRTIA